MSEPLAIPSLLQSRKLTVSKIDENFSELKISSCFGKGTHWTVIFTCLTCSGLLILNKLNTSHVFSKTDALKHFAWLPSSTNSKEDKICDSVAFKAKVDTPSREDAYRQQLHDLKRVSDKPLSELPIVLKILYAKLISNFRREKGRISRRIKCQCWKQKACRKNTTRQNVGMQCNASLTSSSKLEEITQNISILQKQV